MGSSKQKSKTEIIETELSKEQVKIVRQREQFYQNVTQPALQDYFNATRNFELNNDFQNLDDLTAQLDGIFSDDPEEQQFSRDLFRRGFSSEDAAAAQLASGREGAVGREVQGSQARLAALQQGNQNIIAQNQNVLQTQNVRQGGIDALISQAPTPSGSGAPVIGEQKTDNNSAFLGALGGALGSGASTLFGGGGGQTPSGTGAGTAGAGFNQGVGGGNLGGTFDFSSGFLTGGAGGAGTGVFR